MALVGLAAMLLIVAAETVFAAPQKTTIYDVDVTIRGQAGDVLLGDRGPNSLYPRAETNSRIGDVAKLNSLGYADQATLMFDERWDNSRYVEIQSAVISPSPVHCTKTDIYVYSRTVPQWFNQVGAGNSTVGDAGIWCYVSLGQPNGGKGWYFTYPDRGSATGECLSIENLGDTNANGRPEWRFSAYTALPQCSSASAHVYWFEASNKGSQQTWVGTDPGLFEITAEL